MVCLENEWILKIYYFIFYLKIKINSYNHKTINFKTLKQSDI